MPIRFHFSPSVRSRAAPPETMVRRLPPKRAWIWPNTRRRSPTGRLRASFCDSSHTRSLPRLTTSRSMPFMNRSSACGTSSIIVILRSCMSFSRTDGWRLVAKVMFAPKLNAENSDPICSNMWLSGSSDSRRSDGSPGMTSRTDSRLDSRLRWVSITPLASPVVPEVNMISARSSPASSTGCGSPRG